MPASAPPTVPPTKSFFRRRASMTADELRPTTEKYPSGGRGGGRGHTAVSAGPGQRAKRAGHNTRCTQATYSCVVCAGRPSSPLALPPAPHPVSSRLVSARLVSERHTDAHEAPTRKHRMRAQRKRLCPTGDSPLFYLHGWCAHHTIHKLLLPLCCREVSSAQSKRSPQGPSLPPSLDRVPDGGGGGGANLPLENEGEGREPEPPAGARPHSDDAPLVGWKLGRKGRAVPPAVGAASGKSLRRG